MTHPKLDLDAIEARIANTPPGSFATGVHEVCHADRAALLSEVRKLRDALLKIACDEKPIDPQDMTNPFCGDPLSKSEVIAIARAALGDPS
jgi:hypothetical protein